MFACEFWRNPFNGAFHPERLAAADAVERLLLLEDARGCGRRAKIELRRKRDHLLRAGRLAQPALHAGVLGKPQHRSFWIIAQRSGGTCRNTGKAEGATLDIYLKRSERRACGKREDINGGRSNAVQFAQRQLAGFLFFLLPA